MKLGLLQFAPVLGDIDGNLAKADLLLHDAKAKAGDFSLLLLPEMIVTGYVFESRDQVEAIVDAAEKAALDWAMRTSQRFNCSVQIGTPRRASQTSLRNSILLLDINNQQQQTPLFYDKHFLYTTDEIWADEGPNFTTTSLQLLKPPRAPTTIALGICMDINPYRFESPFEKFEFATFHRNTKADLLSCSMAWVLSPDEDLPRDKRTPLMGTINYWATRMTPVILAKEKRVIMAVCNRTGGENGTDFCGSSCVLAFENGGAKLLGVLGYAEEGLLVVDTDRD
ncbi:Carbon-nitrogen hydrolase [Rhizoclosmatium sp. JEL0117]|nr:Carbon-nitrogen hydrolase [Rhizoclosmatium sp. JEL0117]